MERTKKKIRDLRPPIRIHVHALKEFCNCSEEKWNKLQSSRPSQPTSSKSNKFSRQVDTIAMAWQMAPNEYNSFRKEMITVVPELGPSFGKEGENMEGEANEEVAPQQKMGEATQVIAPQREEQE